MDKTFVKGQKLFITTEEATFDATFHSMDEERTRLTVKDVVKHPSEESFDGFYHFYRPEIISVLIMDPLASAWFPPGTEVVSTKCASIMKGCNATPFNKQFIKQADDNELTKDQYKYYSNLLGKFVIIEETDDKFDEVIAEIKKHGVIGISFEGVCIGRKGKLSLISICCDESDDVEREADSSQTPYKFPLRVSLYVFDLALMGSIAITKGLGSILQGKNSPKKVIHDCRLPSDCLFHQFDVKLENVLDTQVAEALMFQPRTRHPEKEGLNPLVFTRSLHQSLAFNLGLPSSLIYKPNINDGYLQKSLDIWYQRPITPLMAKAVTYQTIYLINLWCKVRYVMFSDNFQRGIEIYLSTVRDEDDDDTALSKASYYHLIPEEFLSILMKSHEKLRNRKKKYLKKSNRKGNVGAII